MTPRRSDNAELPAANPPSFTLGSGREISKATLFSVLQLGGWTALTLVCSLAAGQSVGIWPALFDTLIWAVCGFLTTLVLRHIYRRWRRLHHSHVMFAAVALSACVLAAPVWYFVEQLVNRAALAAVLQFASVRPVFAAYLVRTADTSLLITLWLWPFYSIILTAWTSLYYAVNAILELESERANVVKALKLADTARLRALQ